MTHCTTPTYTVAECAEFATQLAEAAAALHKLLTGTKVVELWHANKHVRYTDANLNALRSYVNDLQGKVNACNGTCRPARRFRFLPLG